MDENDEAEKFFNYKNCIADSGDWRTAYAMNAGAARLNQGQEAESMKQLENSIRKATMTCYATEGVYPPTLEYLKKNYGIQIDESRFTVFYEVFAKNLMPEITVMENQERVD